MIYPLLKLIYFIDIFFKRSRSYEYFIHWFHS